MIDRSIYGPAARPRDGVVTCAQVATFLFKLRPGVIPAMLHIQNSYVLTLTRIGPQRADVAGAFFLSAAGPCWAKNGELRRRSADAFDKLFVGSRFTSWSTP
jgi:hypothetical protein